MQRCRTGKVHELGDVFPWIILLDLASPSCSNSKSDGAWQDAAPEYRSFGRFGPICPFFLLHDIHRFGVHSLPPSALHSASKLDNTLLSSDTPHGILRPVVRLGGELVRQLSGQQPPFAPLAGCGSFETALARPL